MNETNPTWRIHGKPDELAEHDALIATDRTNAKRRKVIRNRCRMRGLASKRNET
jgi:hypothetical protein